MIIKFTIDMHQAGTHPTNVYIVSAGSLLLSADSSYCITQSYVSAIGIFQAHVRHIGVMMTLLYNPAQAGSISMPYAS